MEDEKHKLEDEVDISLEKLVHISKGLRDLGVIIFISTMSGVISSLYSLTIFSNAAKKSYGHVPYEVYMVFTVGIIVFSLLILVLYDLKKSYGDTLFEEISDELQWNLNKKIKTEETKKREVKPGIGPRIILREYITTTGLPLARGAYGVTVYLFINMVNLVLFFLIFFILAK